MERTTQASMNSEFVDGTLQVFKVSINGFNFDLFNFRR